MKAVVWRKSVVDNNYKCEYGHLLFKNGNICDDVLVDDANGDLSDNSSLFCPECRKYVAYITSVEEATKTAYKVPEA